MTGFCGQRSQSSVMDGWGCLSCIKTGDREALSTECGRHRISLTEARLARASRVLQPALLQREAHDIGPPRQTKFVH